MVTQEDFDPSFHHNLYYLGKERGYGDGAVAVDCRRRFARFEEGEAVGFLHEGWALARAEHPGEQCREDGSEALRHVEEECRGETEDVRCLIFP